MPDAALTTPAQNARSRQEWAEIINADWRKAVGSIIQVGLDLVGSRKELGRDAFTKMVNEDLLFSRKVASRLMTIAGDQNILNGFSENTLPPSWRVLSALTKLSKDDFEKGIESGIINENTSLRVATAYRGAARTPEGEAWGAGLKPDTLPSPGEARNIARETGRLVSASDGYMYSGATDEEGAEYRRQREARFGAMDAIQTLANMDMTPHEWLHEGKPHWFVEFSLSDIEGAMKWLEQLRKDYCAKEQIVEG